MASKMGNSGSSMEPPARWSAGLFRGCRGDGAGYCSAMFGFGCCPKDAARECGIPKHWDHPRPGRRKCRAGARRARKSRSSRWSECIHIGGITRVVHKCTLRSSVAQPSPINPVAKPLTAGVIPVKVNRRYDSKLYSFSTMDPRSFASPPISGNEPSGGSCRFRDPEQSGMTKTNNEIRLSCGGGCQASPVARMPGKQEDYDTLRAFAIGFQGAPTLPPEAFFSAILDFQSPR